MTKRGATAFFAVLLLSLSIVPAAGACCIRTGGGHMAAMHRSMPCCATNHCSMRLDATRDHDNSAVVAPAPAGANAPAVIATVALLPLSASGAHTSAFTLVEPSPPPAFLLNREFRI